MGSVGFNSPDGLRPERDGEPPMAQISLLCMSCGEQTPHQRANQATGTPSYWRCTECGSLR